MSAEGPLGRKGAGAVDISERERIKERRLREALETRVAELEAGIRAAIRYADKNGMGGWAAFVKLRQLVKE